MAKRYTNPTNIAGMTDAQTEYFASTVYKNGRGLEDKVQEELLLKAVQFKRNKHSGIDFIIDGTIHMDCVATSQSGSIDDKIPTKCFKYLRRYNVNELYILHPYAPIEKNVAEHLEFLEKSMSVKIHILDWNDFIYISNGSRFDVRKPYPVVRNNFGAKGHNTTESNINQYW
jgi:sulfur relay (sulfurtransferase) DsrF/TusC family protein